MKNSAVTRLPNNVIDLEISITLDAMTPWGTADNVTVIVSGITSYETQERNCIKLSDKRNAQVHPMLRSESGWYSEGVEYATVVFTFPAHFSKREQEFALREIKETYPFEYEQITGTVLQPGESYLKDRTLFRKENASRWVVISAINSKVHRGMVECVAMLGGEFERQFWPGYETRLYLVPEEDYKEGKGLFGMIVNEKRCIRMLNSDQAEMLKC